MVVEVVAVVDAAVVALVPRVGLAAPGPWAHAVVRETASTRLPTARGARGEPVMGHHRARGHGRDQMVGYAAWPAPAAPATHAPPRRPCRRAGDL